MYISEIFKTAFIALYSNKTRSFLTMLGVIIGVAAVILLISIGRGVSNYITDQFDALGSNLLFVTPGARSFGNDPASSFTRNKIEEKHVKILQRYAKDSIQYITPYIPANSNVKYKDKSYLASLIGGNENIQNVYNFNIDNGRFFSKTEVTSNAKVIILGPLVAENLFSSRPPIGEKIKVGSETYEVIGVLKPKSSNYDDGALIPYTTMQDTFDIKTFAGIAIKQNPDISAKTAIRQIELAMKRDLDSDEFSVLSQADILSSIQNILSILTLGLGGIAAISLVVGGIGIMNIMLVSVTERTREIGLRKAIGATPRDIAVQFLIESITISLIGGIIGIVFGWAGSLAGRYFIRTEVPWWAVLLAFSFAAIVGIIFGTYPAVKASRKDPIEALRYE